jgi:parallel beta-helix repeat protein
MGQMLIEDNKFHDNYLYGIDPHTGSHDIVIRNNEVYDNNASGIICSKDCYNILIEGNEVYRNGGKGRGIAFSINTTDSIARNNDVHSNERCISFNRESDNNQVYDNTVSNCDVGIYLSNTSNNFIYNNNIVNSKFGIVIKNDTTNNITGNLIDETGTGITLINQNITGNLIDETGTGITLINQNTNGAEIDPNIYYKTVVGPYLDRLKSDNKILDVSDRIASEEGNVKRLKDLLKP